MDKGRMKRWGEASAQTQYDGSVWNIGEEGGCELLSGEREGSSEHAAIFTSLPSLLICRMNINAAAHSRIFLQTHF